ncbi:MULTISPECIES: YbaB/EbfC family nucleoid-associated protein [Hydrogenibacillus]|uniref:Nucleoid-associated protein KM312_05055 n=2 Tax=Hydrogenibacillus schlegelii TaxID=1484 RepID=A0A947GBC8_HYDSH|nr:MULTISPECIES: YbaB/EbfC family nucleoid-associated protein [Hydrogenibacillus]MBE3563851.1 YbaB/EbfC family nucleoid-associated protein [Hydrogenibacillus schlegelii]MBT9282009.1 YbaB/EbfC family nucleoid-associated protein [Hydrogenibacillus schlegelii]QZA33045.1 YbaB/EbfC family nucleoid-associated protein [Hydrogenibacillus sp. N12]
MNMQQMMKQLKKMQEQMEKAQAALKAKTVEGRAGGGAVVVTMNGHKEILGVKIDPSVVDPDDVGLLEDLVQAAVAEALRAAEALAQEDLGRITGGLRIPGLF